MQEKMVSSGKSLSAEQLASLARRLKRRQGASAAGSAIARRTGGAPVPLSSAQQRLWILDRLVPAGLGVYNVPLGLTLAGPLSVPAVASALAEIVRRHEALRTVFAVIDLEPVQVIEPAGAVAVPVIDLAALPAAAGASEAARLAAGEAAHAFDLATGPLFRARLLRLDAATHRLLLHAHHIVADGWSIAVLLAELSELLAAHGEGRPADLPDLAVQYADYAVWQRELLASEALAGELAFWRDRLAGLEPLEISADRPRPAVQEYTGGVVSRQLSPALRGALEGVSRRLGATLFMTLAAAFAAFLARYTARTDLAFGTPVAGRLRRELEALIGLFVNTLVLRVDLAGDPTCEELVERVRGVAVAAFEHQALPFDRLVEELTGERDLSHPPLVQTLFAHEDLIPKRLALPSSLRLAVEETTTRTAKLDLALHVDGSPEGLSAAIEYARSLFDPATIERMLSHLVALLTGFAEDPRRRLSQLPLLGTAEVAQLAAWNGAAGVAHPGGLLHELFFAQAARTPGATALIDGEASLTYAELGDRALALAGALAAMGVGPEAPVGICLERSADLVAGLLGTLAAGAFYVPLDPKYPDERLADLLDDSGCAVVLTRSGSAPRFAGRTLLQLDAPGPLAAPLSRRPPLAPANLAYLIYTSGSTGRPKAVAVTHASAVAFLGWAREVFSPRELSGVLASTAVTFDLSVFEIFVPLAWGGTVILAENVLALPQLAAREQVRLVNTVPSALAELLRSGGLPGSVVTVNLAGEALSRTLCDQVWAEPRVERLLNLYGPSEDTTYSTFAVIQRSADRPPSIGGPIHGTAAHVVDAWGGLQPVGVPGELLLGGAGLARGYWGRPALTAERFVPDPFAAAPGGRLYRTGDLVRRREDGALDYLGRIDRQVKLRGFRIEPGEVEAVLARHPDVVAAVAAVREDEPGDRRLVAWVVVREPRALDVAGLRGWLRRRLPEHLVPGAFVELPELPLTPHGKLDRRALPAPDGHRRSESAAPRTPLERRVAEVWAEVLKVGSVGVADSFWDLGGHSLLATKVLGRLRQATGVELPLQALFEHPTVEALAAALAARGARSAGDLSAGQVERLARKLKQKRASAGAAIPHRAATAGPFPLTFAQERLWLLDRIEPESTAYNLPFSIRWSGPLDPAALERAIAEVVRRHAPLRTRFVAPAGRPVQVVAQPSAVATLPRVDLRGVERARACREADRLAAEWGALPFDIAAGPLLRAALVAIRDDEHLALLSVHHIVADGWSIGVFFRELSTLYTAYAVGRPSPLAELPIDYADFAVWQRETLTGALLGELVERWREMLAGAPPALELPYDRVRPAVASHRGGLVRHRLGAELTHGLRDLSRREGASLFMTLLAGFKLLLARLSGEEDIVVGSPSAGRERVETEGLIGLFLNTLVLRTDLSGDPSFRALLVRVKDIVLKAYRYQAVPFEQLLAELQPERQLNRAPLFQVLFNMLTLDLAPPSVAGHTIEPVSTGAPPSKYDWTLYLSEEGTDIVIESVYDADLFDPGRVEEMLRQYERLLVQAVEAPGAPIGAFSLVTQAAAALLPDPALRLPDEWHGAVHHGLSRSAVRAPDQLALIGEAESWTYGELEARSSQLARSLLACGVSRGDVVALWAQRSPSLVCAVMGTLKAGATMMILDPAYPPARLVDYLEIGRPKAWLAVSGAPEPPPEARAALPDRRVGWDLSSFAPTDPGIPLGPDDPACLTFTSGSTGKPKAVVGRHGPLTHFYPFMAGRFGLSASDRFGMLSALSHDPLQRDIFTPLWLGAALVVPNPERLENPADLAHWVSSQAVSVLHLTPAMLELLVFGAEAGGQELPSLRRAFVVGDQLKHSRVARLYEAARHLTCYNLYGSTETQRSVAYFEVPRSGRPNREVLPLGRGMTGTELVVLTRAGRLAGVGELGEIAMRGPHLARGYLGDAQRTAERFVANPFGAPDRLYRTGDLGRYLPDGNAELVGRVDSQVKIRGFRVELGEVEAVLQSHPAVDDCVVVVREDGPGDPGNPGNPGNRRLVAYVVGHPAPDAAELRGHLASRLPEPMVPGAFVALAALPLTATRKVDRAALPPPERGDEGSYVAPRTATEEVLAAAWAEILMVPQVGVHDNFFALGGDSILAIQLVARLRQRGLDLPPREVFLHQTVAELARVAGGSPGSAGVPPASSADEVGISREELEGVLAEL